MKWLAVAGVILIALILGWLAAFPSATVRYRLTLETEVDGKPAIGSAVVEVSYTKNIQLLGSTTQIVADTRGEAVAVDLSSKGVLFALLKEGSDPRSNPTNIVLRAFGIPHGSASHSIKEELAQIRAARGRVVLPLNAVPMLVRFRDLTDPNTVESVDPNDISKTFGPGVKLVQATIEIVSTGVWPLSWYGITGEPITNAIERRLPWLSKYYDRQLDGRRFETIEAANRLANSLNAAAFKTGK